MFKVYEKSKSQRQLIVPDSWLKIQTIDMHTGGEPLRVILDGFPELQGNSVLEYRRDCQQNHDYLRQLLMFEPRGHADMYGCILVPPNDEGADFGILFLHNEGYSTMCGHAIIAISSLAVQMAWIEVEEGENRLTIDAPCGRIYSFIDVQNGEIHGVSFHCVPSFVVDLDVQIDVKGLGSVTYDLAYGGAFYAYVDLGKNHLDFDLTTSSYAALIDAGKKIKSAVMKSEQKIEHPFELDLSFLYGTIFTETSDKPNIDSRNVCIFADGEVDRSPTGSGVAGRMAIEHARDTLDKGAVMSIESITGSCFKASWIEALDCGVHKAVIPKVSGTAYITGQHQFILDPKDPIKTGFLLR